MSKKDRSSRPCALLETGQHLISKGQIDGNLFQGSLNHFFIGSYDTTGETLVNTLYLLAVNPNIQDKLYEEIITIFPEDKSLEYEELNSLHYMEMVINETMRLFPPIPFVGRLATDDLKLNTVDLNVPKGVHFVISLFHLHRNKKYWGEEPNKFNPDNFLLENVEKRNNNAFMPFVKGPRNCLGWKNGYIVLKVLIFI